MIWEQQKEKFYNFILKNNVIGFFENPIKLKSGRISNWYINWRTVAEDVFLINELTEFVFSFIKYLHLNPTCFYGVPEGATKLGILLQYKWALRNKNIKPGMFTLSMGRGKPKDHGEIKDRFFLGYPKGNVIIIEDVTTTGNSLIESINLLTEMNIKILAALGLTNRNELRDDGKSVADAIKIKNLPYYAMSNALELLPKLNPPEAIKNLIIDYFKIYGEQDITF
jgi:orotate phosphoribosyltransferase